MNTLINSIYEANDESKVELVILMREEIANKQQIIIGDLKRVFVLVNALLLENSTLIIETHQLLITLYKYLLIQELENGLPIYSYNMILNLSDSDSNIRKSAKLVFQKFIQKTRNIEIILDLLSKQFSNKNFYIRERVINLVPDILLQEKAVFSNKVSLNEARKIVEALIIHLNDVNKSVREQSIRALNRIKHIENFDLVYRRLSTEHQHQLDKVQEQLPQKIDKFIQLNLSCLDEQKVVSDEFIPTEFYTQQIYPKMNDLYFGFLREDILQDTLNQKDLAVREQAILLLNREFFSDYEQDISINSQIIQNIIDWGFMPAFFKYISTLFACEDLRILNVLLNILSKIMQVPGVHVNVYLPLSLKGLMLCLQDDRVIIRQRALFLLRQMVKFLKKSQYFQNLIYFLEQKNSNWHLKEEILNLISYLILCANPNEQYFYQIHKKELQIISTFLDDKVAKVKYAALECLAVMSLNYKQNLDYLHEILNEQVYDQLVDKVENRIVYFINDNGNLELPQINIQQFEEERNSYIESQQESIIVREPTPPKSESEKSQQSNYKITYYYDKFPMSMRDKIKASNISIERLFASEHQNIETTKYDIVVPIEQFKQTSTNNQKNEEFRLINSKIYIQKEKKQELEPENYSSEELSDEEQLESIEFEYPTRTLKYRGHAPEQMSKSKIKPPEIDDVKSRVYKTIKQLNEDINVDLQIPKVVKANVNAYQGYSYQAKDDAKKDEEEEEEEIFIDTNQYKQYKQSNQQQQQQQQQQQYSQSITPQSQQKQQPQLLDIQNVINQQQLKYTPEQRYFKRLEEFLLSFEDRNQKGRNARKLRKKLPTDMSNILKYPVTIDNPRAETTALILNLSALSLEILMASLSKFQILLSNYLDDVYTSQANLMQIINDLCRLLSTQNDNPLYAIDYSQYNYPPQVLVREVVFNALQTVSLAAKVLRSVLIQIPRMFKNVGIWLQDENKAIAGQAQETLIDILRFCDDKEIQLTPLYNKQSFESKIYVGVLLEHLVLKYQSDITSSAHLSELVHLISQMVIDISFDVRRQGKKVFFKMLTLSGQIAPVKEVVTQMHQQEKDSMRALLERYQELIKDHQIGAFDEEQYMENQVQPQNFFDIDDLYIQNE